MKRRNGNWRAKSAIRAGFKIPENGERFWWTKHAVSKMRFYGLSEQKIRSVLNSPKRKETGVAPRTLAAMQAAGSKKRPSEIWVMYQLAKLKTSNLRAGNPKPPQVRIISAWRYPGRSPAREVPIPDEILEELSSLKDFNNG